MHGRDGVFLVLHPTLLSLRIAHPNPQAIVQAASRSAPDAANGPVTSSKLPDPWTRFTGPGAHRTRLLPESAAELCVETDSSPIMSVGELGP